MKKYFFCCIACLTMVGLYSCSKMEKDVEKDLVGTMWVRRGDFNFHPQSIEMEIFYFPTQNRVTNYFPVNSNGTCSMDDILHGSYKYSFGTLTITMNGKTATGTINGNTMTLADYVFYEEYVEITETAW